MLLFYHVDRGAVQGTIQTNSNAMKLRILIIDGELSTEDLGPLKRRLREKYQDDELPMYHVTLDMLEEFMKDAGTFPVVFLEKSLSEEKIKLYTNGARVVKGVTLEDDDVIKFISTL